MTNFLGGGQQDGDLSQNSLGPGDQYVQRQIRSWAWLALFFAIFLPWVWLYFSFAYDTGKPLAILAAVVMHIGLFLVWVSRRNGDRRLWWAGVACYPGAVAACLLLKE